MRYGVVTLMTIATAIIVHWWDTPSSPDLSIHRNEVVIAYGDYAAVTYTIGGGGSGCKLPPYRLCWRDDVHDFMEAVKKSY